MGRLARFSSDMINFTAPLQVWRGEEGSVHFLALAGEQEGEIRAHALLNPRGFRSVRVECTIGDVVWRTSLFPQKGAGYFLPVRAEVCRRAAIAVGDRVTISLVLL